MNTVSILTGFMKLFPVQALAKCVQYADGGAALNTIHAQRTENRQDRFYAYRARFSRHGRQSAGNGTAAMVQYGWWC